MKLLKSLFLNLTVFGLMVSSPSAIAAPKPDLWERWTAHDANSSAAIDHSAWNDLLTRYLEPGSDGINRFAYARLQNADADRQNLRNYLDTMSTIEISNYNRDQQRAYWINLYNAITIDVVVSSYPVESIRDIRGGFFSAGPWGLKLIKVENEELTLDDIEHRILRPIWKDPRVHYAVNCASIGCPNLQAQAFTADNTESLLQQGAVAFVNHPRGARVTAGKLHVSSIYDWFDVDFGGTDAGVISHLREYANADLKAALDRVDKIHNDSYDWSINAAVEPGANRSSGRRSGS